MSHPSQPRGGKHAATLAEVIKACAGTHIRDECIGIKTIPHPITSQKKASRHYMATHATELKFEQQLESNVPTLKKKMSPVAA